MDCLGLNQSMPEATTTGRNTFGCKINGETWVAYTDSFGALTGGEPKLRVRYSESSKHARILANKNIRFPNCDTTRQNFILQMVNIGEGLTAQFSSDSEFTDRHLGIRYNVDTLSANDIIITRIDTQNKILSGIFEIQLISDDGLDTVIVTDGRFDAMYEDL